MSWASEWANKHADKTGDDGMNEWAVRRWAIKAKEDFVGPGQRGIP